MKAQDWIFTVRYWQEQQAPLPAIDRHAVVGPARSSTVEAALHLAKMPEDLRVEVRTSAVVRDFVEGRLDPNKTGYYVQRNTAAERDLTLTALEEQRSWVVCIGSVHEVLR